MPEPAFARSFAFIAGRTVSLALNARNHGSAIAGNSDDSFMSKKMYPVRSPLSSAKYAASGFISFKIRSMVVPKLPLRLAALPASTGMETLSIMRMGCALLMQDRLYTFVEPSDRSGWRIVISPIIPYDSPPCYHSSMRHLVVLFIHLHVVIGIGGSIA